MERYTKASKIIILGGTFDPIHNGHIQLAEQLYRVFQTSITFMPTGIPPHKPAPKASNQQRLKMLELAIGDNPEFHIERMEIDIADFGYTYRTLALLREKVGKTIPVYFLIGSDSLLTLDTWHYWETILSMTNFIVAWREGYSLAQIGPALLGGIYDKNKTSDFNSVDSSHGKFYELNFTPQNISSTIIRDRVKQGLDISQLVPQAVAKYILQQQLYKN